jgi:hypothetical protein
MVNLQAGGNEKNDAEQAGPNGAKRAIYIQG